MGVDAAESRAEQRSRLAAGVEEPGEFAAAHRDDPRREPAVAFDPAADRRRIEAHHQPGTGRASASANAARHHSKTRHGSRESRRGVTQTWLRGRNAVNNVHAERHGPSMTRRSPD